MLELHQENKGHKKWAHALRLIYKQAEMGHGDIPKDYSELQEKVAALMTEDLRVVEKALELTGGAIKLGELHSQDRAAPKSANEQFEVSIIGEN